MPKIINCILFFSIHIFFYTALNATPNHLSVHDTKTFIYAKPQFTAEILRKLYKGEIINPIKKVKNKAGYQWIKVSIGNQLDGFIPANKLKNIGEIPNDIWEPPLIIRKDKPFSFGVQFRGKTFGSALTLRYLPFTRLGITGAVGSVLDKNEMKGTNASFGILSCLALNQLTPIVETGFSRISYHANESILRTTFYYISVGVEWMFEKGLYFSIEANYLRSLDREIVINYDKKDQPFTPGNYGEFSDDEQSIVQSLQGGASIGYAF